MMRFQKTPRFNGSESWALGLLRRSGRKSASGPAAPPFLDGSISKLGSQYVRGAARQELPHGRNPGSGGRRKRQRSKDVMNALSQIAIKFRDQGRRIACHGQAARHAARKKLPPHPLDALKAYSAAWKHQTHGSRSPSRPCLCSNRAIQIDPKFAAAHASLGFVVWPSGTECTLSAESNKKAYELRDRASDREKFFIAATYETQLTGDLEKSSADL